VADAFAEGLSPADGSARRADASGRRVDASGRPVDPLSDRETEVLRLAAIGLGDGDIAARLHLSRRTVGNHLGSVYRKLDVANRTAAVHTARERGLLDR
jgi:DNA-binding NarL/FixJ family response regulator